MHSSHAFRWLIAVAIVVNLVVSLPAQQAEYVLGPQDVFTLTIWGPGGTSGSFTVEADGTFIFPMLGRLKAGGLTTRQLQDDLTAMLRDGYYNNPSVTVVINDYRSQHIFVIGEVKSPGTFSLTRSMTLMEALTLAGLPTNYAGATAVVRRHTKGARSVSPVTQAGEGVTEITVDLTALQEGILSNNPILQDGDTIAVPRTSPVYVFGYVARPGEYNVGKDATVRQVLSLAGGVAQRGAAGRMKVIRVTDGVEHELKVELDDRIKPGDTIVVPERYF